MAQLIFSTGGRETKYVIQKKITTVGSDSTHDALVEMSAPGALFTLVREDQHYDLLPGKGKLRVNGLAVSRKTRLASCDRIEWDGGLAAFLTTELPVSGSAGDDLTQKSWAVLQNMSATLQQPGAIQAALYQALDGLIAMSGAETGFLLSESGSGSGWELLAFREEQAGSMHPSQARKKQLFSNTILQEALARREPVYIENIIGHAWASAESVVAAKIFSAACFPLCVGGRVLGAIFLSTQSPGRSVKRAAMNEMSLVATQAALMLALQGEVKLVRRENDQLRTQVQAARGGAPSGSLLVYNTEPGASKDMAELDAKIAKLAPTPLGIVIRGETGSGKEVVAREIHSRSPRASKPFVAVNCGAIPGPLLESTLFGHERGAFTGATSAQQGKFVQANHGTLLLDEIGDLPLDLQVKLLRVLQERKVEPLGSRDLIPIDVRILAATHVDLETAVREGKFRQDLYFRLMGATVKIPALRERQADIPALARFFLEKNGCSVKIADKAMEKLLKHDWPGNVRELEQVVVRASYICERGEITEADVDISDLSALEAPESTLFWSGFENIPNLKEAQLAFTKEFVNRTLEANGGNRTEAASKLGISERTLYRVLAGGSV
ncbi:MAG: sigma-54-dependent Fis family transcriptional regulator [Deltaproteobacteria bacterium]|nr:sigma-54-dependent Fis family transcriptional regulator [Deltaproteobacteria bacterium]